MKGETQEQKVQLLSPCWWI